MAQKEPLDCLRGIVGVADTDCDCFEDGRPEDYNESPSGLYLSQLIDIAMLMQLYDCSGKTIWETGAKALDQATLRFQSNMLQCWAAKHKAREQWKGLVGSRDHSPVMNPSGTYAGLYVQPRHEITDGEMVISGIGTLFNQSGEITVRIYDELSGTFLYEIDLDTTANTFQSNPLATPIVLPYTRNDQSASRYWILYEVGANKPKQGEVNCGCSSAQERMKEWAMLYGATGNTLDERTDWSRMSEHYGLLPEVTFRCKVEKGICSDTLDFATNPNAAVMAEAIWFLAASILPGELRRTMKVLPGTVLPSDDLKEQVDDYTKEFSARVAALCQSMPPGSCYPCRTKVRMVTPHP